MKVNLDTKLHVNSFMMDKFSSKGNVGYLYFKLFVEIYYEKYKKAAAPILFHSAANIAVYLLSSL